jgi:hypothetical protein
MQQGHTAIENPADSHQNPQPVARRNLKGASVTVCDKMHDGRIEIVLCSIKGVSI